MEVDVSLDNVTFVGEWDDWGFVCEALEAARLDCNSGGGGDFDAVRALPARGSLGGAMRHQQAWVVDGAHLSCWVELSTLGRSWVAADLAGRSRGRIELNPNKVTDRVLSLLTCFRVDHVTRADVALDYLGVALGDYVFRRDRVKLTTYQTTAGLEGMMLGGRTSERYVRIYDKARELGRDDLTLTRIEGVGKHRRVMSPELFDGVEAYAAAIPADLSVWDAGRMALVMHHPEYVAKRDKRTRKEWVSLVRDCAATLSPDPAEVYRSSLPELDAMVDAVAAGERVRVAEVYA